MSQQLWNNVSKLLDQSISVDIEKEEFQSISCGLCKKIMIDASQITCGCQFCRFCIEKYLQDGGKRCPIMVTNECIHVLLRDMSDVHREKDCNKKILSLTLKCPRKDCDFESELGVLIGHMNETHGNDEDVISTAFTDESESITQDCESKSKFSANNLIKKLNVLKHKNKKLEKYIEEMDNRIKCLEHDKIRDAQNVDKLIFAVYRLEERLAESKYQPFLWNVNDFKNYKSGDYCLYSEPFYVFKNGYKMRLMMFPNGAYENDVVSVYFEIVRGQFDMLLKWPFCCNVTLTVVAPDGSERYSHTVYYLHHRRRSYVYQRPCYHTNIGLGLSRYIEHTKLLEDGASMLYNDNMFLLCTVADAPSSFSYVD